MTNSGNSSTYFKTVRNTMLACVCLYSGLATGTADAQEAGNGHDLQIQTTLGKLLGEDQAARYKNIIKPDKPLSWEVYLPESASNERPGVLVYISPVSSGRVHPQWRRVMDEQNMIYISPNDSPNDSGNRVRTIKRMVMATMAVRALGEQFAFDTGNIVVSGFSGGGRVASLVATQYPETFSGAVYICGVDPWKAKDTPKVERLIQNRFVFLTGSKDFNRYETRKVHKQYADAGAQHSKLIVVPGMAHVLPAPGILAEALEFVSSKRP